MRRFLLIVILSLSLSTSADETGMTIIFDNGTSIGPTAGAVITVVNGTTGVSTTKRVGTGYTASGCATVLMLAAGEAGVKTQGVGLTGVRLFGAGNRVTVSGECPYHCSVPNCN